MRAMSSLWFMAVFSVPRALLELKQFSLSNDGIEEFIRNIPKYMLGIRSQQDAEEVNTH